MDVQSQWHILIFIDIHDGLIYHTLDYELFQSLMRIGIKTHVIIKNYLQGPTFILSWVLHLKRIGPMEN
jgi:hypothetical protein